MMRPRRDMLSKTNDNDMLSKANDTTVHIKKCSKLMMEFCNYLYGLSATIMEEAYRKRILKYNLRSCRHPRKNEVFQQGFLQ